MNILILHGTSASHESNWFPWLKNELEKLGHNVWLPDLPDADHPNIQKYSDFLLNSDWDYEGSVIIGHSSGSVAILGLLQALPAKTKLSAAVLVGAFTERLAESPSWEMLRELFGAPFDFTEISKKSEQFIFIHSKDDPYCPIDQAKELSQQVNGEFIEFEGMGHFSYELDKRFKEFPELLDILQEEVL